MPSFLADSIQEPIRKEVGDFIKVRGRTFRMTGDQVASLVLTGFICVDTEAADPRYPYRNVYKLLRFTINEEIAICGLLGAVTDSAKID